MQGGEGWTCSENFPRHIEPDVSAPVWPSSANGMSSPGFEGLCGEDGSQEVLIFWSKHVEFKICHKISKSTDFLKATFVNPNSSNVTDYLLLGPCVYFYLQAL